MEECVEWILDARYNYEGFAGYWPSVATNDTADRRDRVFAQWLDEVEKIAFSTTLDRVD